MKIPSILITCFLLFAYQASAAPTSGIDKQTISEIIFTSERADSHVLSSEDPDLFQLEPEQQSNSKLQKGDILLHVISAGVILISIVLILRFNRKLKRANQKLKKQQRRLSKQKSDLEKSNEKLMLAKEKTDLVNEYKNQFMANMSHEIRTPLNAISSYSKLLMPKLTEAENKRYMHNILTSVDNMIVIVNDILDFSNIESGQIKFDSVVFNPLDVLTQTVSTLKLKAEEKNIALEIHIDPSIPDELIGDPNRLAQILTNLINNAIKFSYNNSTVSIDATGTTKDNYCRVEMNIRDRGVGIEESKINLIFNSFEQANSSTVRNFGGTGLGLTIVKRLVDLQKGDIWVKSELNKGTTFTVILNFAVNNGTSQADKRKESKIEDINNEVAILLVEDNFLNQEITKDTIASWGDNFQVSIANNGEEAINLLKEKDFAVVLMDIQMPVMDGHIATQTIRNTLPEPKRNVPIIGMTAHAFNSEKELALKNGMNDYIIKPFNPDELKQKIIYFVTNVKS